MGPIDDYAQAGIASARQGQARIAKLFPLFLPSFIFDI